jgi:adenylate cyclase
MPDASLMKSLNRSELIEWVIDSLDRRVGEGLSARQRHQLQQALFKSLDTTLCEDELPQARQVTILLTDLRGFTAVAEQYPPHLVVKMLNHYFTRMCEIVFRHGGFVDKFMGDAVMVVFGLPDYRQDDLQRAIACAVEMQHAMLEVNERMSEQGYPRLYMGVGINTGEVVVGRLGSDLHHEYTIIGDSVNLAFRIEAYSLRGQVLLSEHSRHLAESYIDCGPPNQVELKGKEKPMNLYELLATYRPHYLAVPRVESRRSPRILVDFPISFQTLKEKTVVRTQHQGRAVDLSYNGLHAYLPMQLRTLSDIRITLSTSLMSRHNRYIYAKVLDAKQEEGGWLCRMEFTRIDEEGQAAIKSFIDQAVALR